MKKHIMPIIGAAAGILNGFFGSGGGIAAVPMLKSAGLEAKRAHASSLAVTLPLSAVSAFFYLKNSAFELHGTLMLIVFGLAGAAIGALFLKKIPTLWLSRIFGVILIIAGIRGLLV